MHEKKDSRKTEPLSLCHRANPCLEHSRRPGRCSRHHKLCRRRHKGHHNHMRRLHRPRMPRKHQLHSLHRHRSHGYDLTTRTDSARMPGSQDATAARARAVIRRWCCVVGRSSRRRRPSGACPGLECHAGFFEPKLCNQQMCGIWPRHWGLYRHHHRHRHRHRLSVELPWFLQQSPWRKGLLVLRVDVIHLLHISVKYPSPSTASVAWHAWFAAGVCDFLGVWKARAIEATTNSAAPNQHDSEDSSVVSLQIYYELTRLDKMLNLCMCAHVRVRVHVCACLALCQ